MLEHADAGAKLDTITTPKNRNVRCSIFSSFSQLSNRLDNGDEIAAGNVIGGSNFWSKKIIRSQGIAFVCILHRGIVARAMEEFPNDREIFMPFLASHAHKKKKQPEEKKDAGKVANILRERSIFANTSPDFVNAIIKSGISRIFMPGDRIIEQGAEGTSMFILWLGHSCVVNEKCEEQNGFCVRTLTSVGTLPYGSVFGELVMLGVHQRRTASIIATTVCCAWEVAQANCLMILKNHPTERHDFLKLVEEHLEKLAAPRIIYHPLFSCFHQQLRTLIGVNCEKKLFFPGETVVKEGSTGVSLYVVNLGTADIEIAHQHVMQISSGAYFGFGVMCGTQDRYPATVIAKTMCQVLSVGAATYRNALQKYPEMIAKAKALEAEEKVRQTKESKSFTFMVRKRKGIKNIIDTLKGSVSALAGGADETSSAELLETIFQAWSIFATKTVKMRREIAAMREGNVQRIAEYVEKRKLRMDKVMPQLDLRRLVKENLEERGPLKLASMPCPRRRKAHSESPQKLHSTALDAYLSPIPPRHVALSAREKEPSLRLPPLVAACTPREMPKASQDSLHVSVSARSTSNPPSQTRRRRMMRSRNADGDSQDELT
jgi:CRP-like cAMP-binding protein